MNIEKLHPVIVDCALINRHVKREVQQEIERHAGRFTEIEQSFYDHLFDESNGLNYEEIYTKHLEWYVKTVEWVNNYGRLRKIKLNTDYFYYMMCPMEAAKA